MKQESEMLEDSELLYYLPNRVVVSIKKVFGESSLSILNHFNDWYKKTKVHIQQSSYYQDYQSLLNKWKYDSVRDVLLVVSTLFLLELFDPISRQNLIVEFSLISIGTLCFRYIIKFLKMAFWAIVISILILVGYFIYKRYIYPNFNFIQT